MSLAAGARLGPCELVAPLGAGGMGEVYRARDVRLGREPTRPGVALGTARKTRGSPRTGFLTFSGQDWDPAASPAGRLVAFVSRRDGRSRIWIKQLGSGEEVAVSSVRTLAQRHPFFMVPSMP